MPDIVGSGAGLIGIPHRHQEVAEGEFAPEVYTVSAVTAAVAKQRFFMAGTGKLTLSLAGNLRATIGNPAGSGRMVYIARIAGLASAGPGWARFRINPTTGLPTGLKTPINVVIGSVVTAVTEVNADTSTTTAVGGGTDTGIDLGIPTGERISIDLPPLVLSPGVMLGINTPFAGATDTALSVYWFEDDI